MNLNYFVLIAFLCAIGLLTIVVLIIKFIIFLVKARTEWIEELIVTTVQKKFIVDRNYKE